MQKVESPIAYTTSNNNIAQIPPPKYPIKPMSETEPVPQETSLSETGLEVTPTQLLRKRNGNILSTWALDEIQAIRVGSMLNPFSVSLIGSARGILYLRWALGLGTILASLLY
jgi:hypothetical protein